MASSRQLTERYFNAFASALTGIGGKNSVGVLERHVSQARLLDLRGARWTAPKHTE